MNKKLTPEAIRSILAEKQRHNDLIASGSRDTKRYNAQEIARRYGVSHETVYKIFRRGRSREVGGGRGNGKNHPI